MIDRRIISSAENWKNCDKIFGTIRRKEVYSMRVSARFLLWMECDMENVSIFNQMISVVALF